MTHFLYGLASFILRITNNIASLLYELEIFADAACRHFSSSSLEKITFKILALVSF